MLFSYRKGLPSIRHFVNNVALLSKNHYDALGLTPKATQADVKSAYYKLSMLYHPDKNEGSYDAADKFREVTEAYEVLGNIKARRLYDKGTFQFTFSLFTADFFVGIQSYHSVEVPVYQRKQKAKPPPPTGKTPIYDFDEWSRAHYGQTFAKDMHIRHAINLKNKKRRQEINEIKSEKVMLAMFIIIGICMFLSYENHDTDATSSNSIPSRIEE